MKEFKEYIDAWFSMIPNFGSTGALALKPGLERVEKVLEVLGNPHRRLKSVHIAGTNGKGSVSCMTASILQEHGYKVGLFTSPHLIEINERFVINGAPIEDKRLWKLIETNRKVIEENELSYFERTFVIAMIYFSEENCDFAVIETGLGGRLDATNCILPEVSVITSIGFDHQEILGNSLEAIALEKAGIMKQDCTVIIGKLPFEAESTIKEVALQKENKLIHIDGLAYLDEGLGIRNLKSGLFYESDLVGEVQKGNMKMALTAAEILLSDEHFKPNCAALGLKKVRKNTGFKGRMEKLHPSREWFFDGGHNIESITWLIRTLELYKDRKPVVVVSFMKDKPIEEALKKLSFVGKIYYVNLDTERSLKLKDIPQLASRYEIKEIHTHNVKEFFVQTEQEVVIFTGSFYLYQKIITWISHFLKD